MLLVIDKVSLQSTRFSPWNIGFSKVVNVCARITLFLAVIALHKVT